LDFVTLFVDRFLLRGDNDLLAVASWKGFGIVGFFVNFGCTTLWREKSGAGLALKACTEDDVSRSFDLPFLVNGLFFNLLGEIARSSVDKWNGFGTVIGRTDFFGFTKLV